jgi:hypothetical protein
MFCCCRDLDLMGRLTVLYPEGRRVFVLDESLVRLFARKFDFAVRANESNFRDVKGIGFTVARRSAVRRRATREQQSLIGIQRQRQRHDAIARVNFVT